MDYQYPIGRAEIPTDISMQDIEGWIRDVEEAPSRLRDAVAGLSDAQLDTPYRPEGWTVRQVVHHLPDSHMSTYFNFRSALVTDDSPMRSLDVNASANLQDCIHGDVAMSLDLFDAMHRRWVALMKSMTREDFERTLIASNGAKRRLATMLCIYAWHGKHHVAHITSLRERMGW